MLTFHCIDKNRLNFCSLKLLLNVMCIVPYKFTFLTFGLHIDQDIRKHVEKGGNYRYHKN